MRMAPELRRLAAALGLGLMLRLLLGLGFSSPAPAASPVDLLANFLFWSGSSVQAMRVGMAALGDAATLWLLMRIWLRLKPERQRLPSLGGRAFWAALAWAAWPVVAWAGLVQGHGESLVLALLLNAAWLLEFSDHPQAERWAALSCGLAMLLNPWALLTLPIYTRALLSSRERFKFFGLSFLILAIPLAASYLFSPAMTLGELEKPKVFALGLGGAVEAALKATGASPAGLENAAAIAQSTAWAVLSLMWLWMLFSSWRPPLLAGLSLAGLMVWVFAPQLELRHLVWALGFSLLLPGRWALRLGLASSLALGLALLLRGRELPAWGLALLAFAQFGFWLYACAETLALLRICVQPKGKLDYQA